MPHLLVSVNFYTTLKLLSLVRLGINQVLNSTEDLVGEGGVEVYRLASVYVQR